MHKTSHRPLYFYQKGLCTSSLGEAIASSVTPSVISFNATVGVCETFAAWPSALALLAQLALRRGRRPAADVVTYNAAISACGKASEWQQALQLLEQMELKQLKADTISCNSAISACEKAHKWQKALSILQQETGGGKTGVRNFLESGVFMSFWYLLVFKHSQTC